jgi:Fe2+ transport system protein B
MIVLTKTDKLNRQQVKVRETALERELNTGVLPFSSVTGLGKLELRRALLDLVAEFKPKGRQKKERAVHV